MIKLISNIEITVSEMGYGWQMIHLIFDDVKIDFYASYLGECPLSSLITLIAEIDADIENENIPDEMYIKWFDEPGVFQMDIKYDGINDDITIRISDEDLIMGGQITTPREEYHISVNHESFRNAIIKEASRMLRTYGLHGYNGNWAKGIENFPLSAFLRLLGNKSKFDKETETYSSSLEHEISLLKSILTI